MPKLYANPNCSSCLGSGRALSVFGGEHPCSCLFANVTIVRTEDKDYSIPAEKRVKPNNNINQIVVSRKELEGLFGDPNTFLMG